MAHATTTVHDRAARLRYRGYMLAAAVLASLSLSGAVGCSAAPAPRLPEPEPIPAGSAPVPAPRLPPVARPAPIAEEPIEAEQPAIGAPEEAGVQPAEPESAPDVLPSPLASLTASAAPHVVAATRLAEEGRQRLAGGDPDTALEQLERAIAIDPANPYAYYYLAEIHFARGSYQQAIAFADRAATLSARADSGWLSRAYGLQGKVFEAAGRFADARVAYQRAIEADHRNRAAQAGLDRLSGGPPPVP